MQSASFQYHHINALLGQFVGQSATAGPGTDDHHDTVIVVGKSLAIIELRHSVFSSGKHRLVVMVA